MLAYSCLLCISGVISFSFNANAGYITLDVLACDKGKDVQCQTNLQGNDANRSRTLKHVKKLMKISFSLSENFFSHYHTW